MKIKKQKNNKIFFLTIICVGIFANIFFGTKAFAASCPNNCSADPNKKLCNIVTGICVSEEEASKLPAGQIGKAYQGACSFSTKESYMASLGLGDLVNGTVVTVDNCCLLAEKKYGYIGNCNKMLNAKSTGAVNGGPGGTPDPNTQAVYPSLNNNAITPTPKQFEYPLLESFPGFFKAKDNLTDLPSLILAIYKFGIWTVGIAGFFMLVVGGFMYMGSAGNTSTAGSARGIIADALLGIVAALGAYLILYVINPELTKINISFTTVDVTETSGIGEGGGNCATLQTGPCSVINLQKTCFGANAEAASRVCNYESGGNANSPSKTDKGIDGNIFSWGLFQINLTQHSLGGYDCQSAFKGKNYVSSVINPTMYANCKSAATTAQINIDYACKISKNGTNWSPWANTKKACGL
ncbi:MAG: hypothetical protein PHW24_03905 [Candidatus Moranbacteria bacterium]|nr:hypothetical protein [Candidatus Moranbacteria bacterium]